MIHFLALLLFPQPSWAIESPPILTVEDAIRGEFIQYSSMDTDDETRKRAFESHEKSCKNWTTSWQIKLEPKTLHLSLECGTAEIETLGIREKRGIQVVSSGVLRIGFRDPVVKIEEVVRGSLIINQENAKLLAVSSYDKACKEWKEKVTELFENDLLLSTCGGKRHTVSIGESNARRSTVSVPPAATIYQSASSGTIVVKNQGDQIGTATKSIHSTQPGPGRYYLTGSSDPATAESYREANCRDWKAQVKSQYGNRFIYATCEMGNKTALTVNMTAIEKPTKIDDDGYSIGPWSWFYTSRSKGEVYYYLE